MMLGPVQDGIVIQESPEVSVAKGVCKDITILIGTNKDEYNLYSILDTSLDQLDDEGIKQRLAHMLPDKWPHIAAHLSNRAFNKELVEQIMTFDIFTAPAIYLAEEQVKQGGDVWMYRFDWETPILNGSLKSCHALEIPFVWNALGRGAEFLLGNAPNQELSDYMHKAWAVFAKHGDPNIEELPIWPAYQVKNRETMLFDQECRIVNDPEQELRLIWEAGIVGAQ